MAKYDNPAVIDYILGATQQSKLFYVGFSLGNAVFFATMHHLPQYNEKVRI